ncbi:MAG: IS110 family transposase [Actinobacteria bacterium]|nr:IS110 family transposase [Actinomycetota bacterium]
MDAQLSPTPPRQPARLTMGVDVGDRFSQICTLDAAGEIVEEARIRTTPAGLERWFRSVEPTLVILEAGTHSPWISRLLHNCGHETIVANPRRVRLIYANDRKSDRVDAESLARVGRLDPRLLHPVKHRGAEAQADLALLRSRDALIRARTLLINHMRGASKAVGGRLPACSARSFHRKVEEHIPAELSEALRPELETIAGLTAQIRDLDKRVEEMAKTKYREVAGLRQVAGVGPITATTYVLTLEDPGRFPRSRAVGCYVGLRPRQADSGEQRPQLHITKAGDEALRALLVGAAHYILGPYGPDSDLRRWGLALAERGGKAAKKRAVVAVARKLAVLLHRLWETGEIYDPLHNARLRGEVDPAG